MGRSKQSRPLKRRKVVLEANDRIVVEESFAERKEEVAAAIEFLRKTPKDVVEAAAAEATFADLSRKDRWITLKPPPTSTTIVFEEDQSIEGAAKVVPSWLGGLGYSRLATKDFEALQSLHQMIKDRVEDDTEDKIEWASWSGSTEDPRKRAFGFLPGTWGYDPKVRNEQLDISMPDNDENTDEERQRNKRAMVVLEKVPEGVREAIENLCKVFREGLVSTPPTKDSTYRENLIEYLHYEQLIAAQPNLHSGRALLPLHLDDPSKDGFGVIILTIGMKGSGRILLRDAESIEHGYTMNLKSGEAYLLSGNARDACAHGVLADPQNEDRESLNLRFGLHDVKSSLPFISSEMVFRHWKNTR